jgi:hypothetical protein
MKRQSAILTILAMVVMAVPAWGGDDIQALKVYYDKAITKEITCCQKMSSTLQSSTSPNLRLKGHKEASKAIFLQAHREKLIEEMMAEAIPPKDYQVDLFLNTQFCGNCYAHWVAKGKL